MLSQLLTLLEQGGVQTPRSLAAALDTSEALVVEMAEQLVRQGYLKEIGNCTASCTSCGVHQSGCQTPSGARLWVLTDRARRITTR